MKNIRRYLNDKTSKLNKIDYVIIGVLILIFELISLYHLGDTKVPQTFYAFNSVGDSVTVKLEKETYVSKILYYTGYNIGDFDILIPNEKNIFESFKTLTTYSVLSWEEFYIDNNIKSLQFVSKTKDATIGDIVLFDQNGNKINNVISDVSLVDETDLAPDYISYMNSMYFDEIYFGRTAYDYAHGISAYEWSHPPLGKIIMSLPVTIFGFSPFSTRLMGNIFGMLLIPLMYILAKMIFKNRKYALLGALLMMFDNFHFVESRIALGENIQIFFILLSVIFMKKYLDLGTNDSFKTKALNLILSGLFIGCAISVKWNSCYVALGLAIVFFTHLIKEYHFNVIKYVKDKVNILVIFKYIMFFILIPLSCYYLIFIILNQNNATIFITLYYIVFVFFLLRKFINFIKNDQYLLKLFLVCVFSFIIIPLVIYILSYLLFPKVDYYDGTLKGIIDINKMMYDYHANLDATHPFTSKWYEWPIMKKPIWFYSSGDFGGSRMTITSIGNPLIWWFGIVAFIHLVISSIRKNKDSIFLLTFILASYIPYVFIGRIMFMYHFYITLPFVMLAIVSFIKWITEKYKTDKVYYFYILFVIIMFIIFYPIVSGIMIENDYIEALKWLSSWNF